MIVAGGRGLGGPENFSLVEELAKALGGAVAATRAVVDAGWYPYSTQVGQTGKTVSPKLYVACGISGAIQHKVGMQGSGTDRRDQQGPERADLRVLRPRRRRRPERDRPEAHRARRTSARRMTAGPPTSRRRSARASSSREPTDPADERIDVGILIVGAGPAGLAVRDQARPAARGAPGPGGAARRRPGRRAREGQAARLAPALRRRRQPARPAPAVRDEKRIEDMPFYGEVDARGRLLPARSTRRCASRRRRRCGTTATTSRRSRSSAAGSREQAEEAGAMILPETVAEKLLVKDGARRRRPHRRQGTRPRRRAARRTSSRARDLARARHRPRRGDAGPPDRRRDRAASASSGDEPAGVGARREGGVEGREAAAPRHPHDGLAAAAAREVPRVRRLVHLPDGRRHAHDRDGRRARLPRRRALRPRPAPGAEDPPARARRSSRAASASPGARRRFPRAGSSRCRAKLHAPGLLLCGDGAGMVNVPALKGIHYASSRGGSRPRRRSARCGAARTPCAPARSGVRRGGARELHLVGPQGGAQHAAGVRPRLLLRRRAREAR